MNSQRWTWGESDFELYVPIRNKKKLALLGGLSIPFVLTIGTNWIYMIGLGILNKYNPLWIYR